MEPRYMFKISVTSPEDCVKWLKLLHDNPGWGGPFTNEQGGVLGDRYIPNMTYRCATLVEEKLNDVGLTWEWIDDVHDTALYNSILKAGGWGSTIRNVGGEQTVTFTRKLLNLLLKK